MGLIELAQSCGTHRYEASAKKAPPYRYPSKGPKDLSVFLSSYFLDSDKALEPQNPEKNLQELKTLEISKKNFDRRNLEVEDADRSKPIEDFFRKEFLFSRFFSCFGHRRI